MVKLKQPWLSNLEKVEKIKKQRKLPQPKLARPRPIKKFEILHRPFDLKFRGRLHQWLNKSMKTRDQLENILDPIQIRLIKLYLFPRKKDGKWLTQVKVAERIKGINKYKVRVILISALMQIWSKTKMQLYTSGKMYLSTKK